MIRKISLAAIGLLVACGQRSFLDVQSISAVRGADNRVTVTARIECNSSATGDDCLHPDTGPKASSYCAVARFTEGATLLDSVQTCGAGPVATEQTTQTLTLVSDLPMPADAGVEIAVAIDGGFGERDTPSP